MTQTHGPRFVPTRPLGALILSAAGLVPWGARAQPADPPVENPLLKQRPFTPPGSTFKVPRNFQIAKDPAQTKDSGKDDGLPGPLKKAIREKKAPLRSRYRRRPKAKANPAPAPAKAPTAAPTPKPSAPKKTTPTKIGNAKKIEELRAASQSKKCVPMPRNERTVFDFHDELPALVKAVSKITCKNFILTNKIRSQKFQIVSQTPVTVAEIWRAFLSSLEANDFTLVQSGRYYKIIPANDAARSPVPTYSDDQSTPISDRIITKIYKVRYGGDVNQIVTYLNIFKTKQGQIHPFAPTGTIIITDYGTTIARLERILLEVDRPGGLEQVHVVDVNYAAASEIAEKLTQIFEPHAAPAGGSGRSGRTPTRIPVLTGKKAEVLDDDDGVSVSKILADDRTNKLIIVASKRAFRQIMELKRELDVPEDATEGQIHVVPLRHADAEELASTLSALAQGQSGGSNTRRPRTPAKGKAPKKAGSTAASLFQGEVKVTADKATNRLVITASKSDLTSIKRVIEQLDVARFQVFVEAVIMEVSATRDRTLGVGWHGGVAPTIDGERSPIIFGNTPNQELSSLLTTAGNPLGLASLLGFAGAAKGPAVPGTEDLVTGGIPALGVVLQALQSTNDVNVISTPHLLTMDNEEAEIQVNEKRPFPTGLTLGLGGLGGIAGGAAGQSGGLNFGGLGLGSVGITREDIGLTLKLTPQINDEDYVRLDIDQELSDVAGTDQITNQQITSKRSAKTVVVVRNQDSVVIGGLVRDRETVSESKTPLLGDIPILGWLFKRQKKTAEKVNLVLILTPYIIRGPADFRKIYERKMEERKEFINRFVGDAPEYKARIDWDRKLGALAYYRKRMRDELRKAENDGPGTPDELIIRPGDDVGDPEAAPAVDSGDATPDATPEVPGADEE